MRFLASFALLALALGLSSSLFASGKKPEETISFHIEAGDGGNKKMVFEQLVAGQRRFFSRSATFTGNDIAAFSPFPSDPEGSYGIVFQLTRRGAGRLSAMSAANKGRWMVAAINGEVIDAVIIDEQVNDGILVVWKGVTLPEIKQLDKHRPRIRELDRKR